MVGRRVLFHNASAAASPPGGRSDTQSYEVRDGIEFRRKRIWCAAQKTSARIGKAAAPALYYTQLATEGYIMVSSMLRGRKKCSLPHAAMRVPRLNVITFRVFALLMAFSLLFLRMESQNQVNPAPTRFSGPTEAASTGVF